MTSLSKCYSLLEQADLFEGDLGRANRTILNDNASYADIVVIGIDALSQRKILSQQNFISFIELIQDRNFSSIRVNALKYLAETGLLDQTSFDMQCIDCKNFGTLANAIEFLYQQNSLTPENYNSLTSTEEYRWRKDLAYGLKTLGDLNLLLPENRLLLIQNPKVAYQLSNCIKHLINANIFTPESFTSLIEYKNHALPLDAGLGFLLGVNLLTADNFARLLVNPPIADEVAKRIIAEERIKYYLRITFLLTSENLIKLDQNSKYILGLSNAIETLYVHDLLDQNHLEEIMKDSEDCHNMVENIRRRRFISPEVRPRMPWRFFRNDETAITSSPNLSPGEDKTLDSIGFPRDLIPEEYLCKISFDIMKNPVRLPGEVSDVIICDYDSVRKALISTNGLNPFNRQAMTLDEVVEENDLKKEIQKYTTTIIDSVINIKNELKRPLTRDEYELINNNVNLNERDTKRQKV